MKSKRVLTLISGCVVAMTINTNLTHADTTDTGYKRPITVNIGLPLYYPAAFPNVGVLTEQRGRYDWGISGKAFKVSSNIIVHSLVTNFSSLYSVKQGMELAYRLNKDGEVAECWEFPAGTLDLN